MINSRCMLLHTSVDLGCFFFNSLQSVKIMFQYHIYLYNTTALANVNVGYPCFSGPGFSKGG